MNMPSRVAAAAVIGVLAVGGTLYLVRPGQPAVGPSSPTAGSSSTPNTAAISPSPTSSPPFSTPSSSSEPCVKLDLKTGDALPAIRGDSLPNLGQGRGAFLAAFDPARPNHPGLWAVGPGSDPARPIAAIELSSGAVEVLDLSPDGSNALIRAGYNGPGDPNCADIVVVRTDGSGATRLTTFELGSVVDAAAFSPDSRHLAYSWRDFDSWPGFGTLSVLDLASGRAMDQPCNNTAYDYPFTADWSPSGDRIAVACHGGIWIFDPSATSAPIAMPTIGSILAFGWADDSHIVFASEGGETSTLDVASKTSTVLGSFSESDIEIVSASGVLSPDGRWLAYAGGERGDVPGPDFRIVSYLVPTSGGRPIRVLSEREAWSTVGWSADSRALLGVFNGPGNAGSTLGRLDVETLKVSAIGPLSNAGQGVWRIP
jgi:Tol biopolymer transport system component